MLSDHCFQFHIGTSSGSSPSIIFNFKYSAVLQQVNALGEQAFKSTSYDTFLYVEMICQCLGYLSVFFCMGAHTWIAIQCILVVASMNFVAAFWAPGPIDNMVISVQEPSKGYMAMPVAQLIPCSKCHLHWLQCYIWILSVGGWTPDTSQHCPTLLVESKFIAKTDIQHQCILRVKVLLHQISQSE